MRVENVAKRATLGHGQFDHPRGGRERLGDDGRRVHVAVPATGARQRHVGRVQAACASTLAYMPCICRNVGNSCFPTENVWLGYVTDSDTPTGRPSTWYWDAAHRTSTYTILVSGQREQSEMCLPVPTVRVRRDSHDWYNKGCDNEKRCWCGSDECIAVPVRPTPVRRRPRRHIPTTPAPTTSPRPTTAPTTSLHRHPRPTPRPTMSPIPAVWPRREGASAITIIIGIVLACVADAIGSS